MSDLDSVVSLILAGVALETLSDYWLEETCWGFTSFLLGVGRLFQLLGILAAIRYFTLLRVAI